MLTQQIPSQAPKTSVGEGPERDLEQESVVCRWRRKKGQPILATLGSPVTFSFGVLLFPFECSELSRGWEGQKQQQNQKWTPGPRGLVAYAVFVHLCCVNFSVCYPSLSNSAWDLVPSEGHCLLRGAMCGGIQLSNKASCLQPSLQLSLPHTPPHPTGFLILGPEQVTSCLPRALGVSPGACPPHTHCVPVVENYSLIRQRALASVPLPVPGLVPLPKCPSSLHLRDSTRLASPPLGSHPLCANGHSGLFLATPGLCAQHRAVSVTPWEAQFLFLSPTSAIWEKVGRGEGTGLHPLGKGELWVRLRCGHCSLIPPRIHSRG